jgi:hypothetical protein
MTKHPEAAHDSEAFQACGEAVEFLTPEEFAALTPEELGERFNDAVSHIRKAAQRFDDWFRGDRTVRPTGGFKVFAGLVGVGEDRRGQVHRIGPRSLAEQWIPKPALSSI